MANSLDKMEEDALNKGSLLITDHKGHPLSGMENVWFIWYRTDIQETGDFKILTKSFSVDKNRIESVKDSLSKFDCQVGVGKLDMLSGEMVLYKPDKG